jgi:hypothetical protein
MPGCPGLHCTAYHYGDLINDWRIPSPTSIKPLRRVHLFLPNNNTRPILTLHFFDFFLRHHPMTPFVVGIVFLCICCQSVEPAMAFPIPPSMRNVRLGGAFASRASHVTLPIPEWAVLCIFITGRCMPAPPPSSSPLRTVL